MANNRTPRANTDAPMTLSEAWLSPQKRERFLGHAWGVAAPFICTLIDWPLRDLLGPASILMTYLLGVFLVASRYGRSASIVASLLSAPTFAFYFARPIFSFAISDLENIVGLAVMIIVANVTGSLLEKSRMQAELAKQRESHTNALYRLSRDLAAAQDHNAVARIAAEHIDNEFGTDSVLLIANTENGLQIRTNQALPVSLQSLDHTLAQQAFETGEAKLQPPLSYYPLQGSSAAQGILAVLQTEALARQTPEVNTFCHLIAQTLERFQLAAQAREANLQAETEALRNALLSSISHDLRTPLTRIIGAVGTAIENDAGLSAPERQELNQSVLEEAQRMSELTGKILDMARLSSGQIILQRSWNTIEEIVGSALNRMDKQLQDRPVRTLLPDSLPLVWIDAVLIEQVLVNLIENAVKYTSPGSPIDIEAVSLRDQFRLTVADYGPGIAKNQQIRIFEKFYRGTTETGQNGVGLGLALCKAIVEAHGGMIYVKNRIGKGAEFLIELPLHEPPPLVESEALGGLA
ncbi:ATP-binding protein [Methylomonas sp. ZR1]|uniref:ATP-binding protein n=1 Tax=Methylomonas sp. ZR1 TaxID=1797072 RepID=UPI0020A42DDB|nr:ATP-binding protein [Methylomonas sp. ZR1]